VARPAPPGQNQRLAVVGYNRTFTAIDASPGARAHYDRRKASGERHTAAQRNLFGCLLDCLRHCLATGRPYDELGGFARFCQAYGIKTSVGGTGVCWDNATAESFFAALKNKMYYRQAFLPGQWRGSPSPTASRRSSTGSGSTLSYRTPPSRPCTFRSAATTA
jgi:transposase InsO family protein